MNVRLLIDDIVRQTTVLIAQLATSGGLRAPLAHVAEQVFFDLAKELENQGVPSKVRADMFGMALRTYQRRTQRLSQSTTEQGRSLWQAVFEHLAHTGVMSREDLFWRFRYDDEAALRGVLRDLTESGLVFSSGTERSSVYRAATDEELGQMRRSGDPATAEALVWSILYREGPSTIDSLLVHCGVPRPELEPLLGTLVQAGRIERVESGGVVHYRSRELVLGLDNPAGWEGAVLDHFSAFVRTITRKLSQDQQASLGDETGGSTYHFVLWRGHPMEQDVFGELRRFRQRMSALRDRIDTYNRGARAPRRKLKVDAYYGQSYAEQEGGPEGTE